MNKGLNVLSLFDGISCGQVALQRAGIKVNKYFASEIDKHAIKVTQHNHPNTIQLGDINNWKSWDLPEIDLVFGGSPCFPAGTKIILKEKIENIEDVKVGDSVLTHKNRYRKVIKIGGKKSQPTLTVKAQGIPPVKVTKDHPFYTREMTWKCKDRKSYRHFSEPVWTPAGELNKKTFLGIPIINSNSNDLNLTEEEAFILGRYIADGHTSKHYRKSEGRPNDRHWQMILSVGALKVDIFTREIKENKFSVSPHTKSVNRITFCSKRLVQIAEEHCGCGAANKKISKILLDLPVNILEKLINGILSGDGHLLKNGEWAINSVSKGLMQILSLAVLKVYHTVSSYTFTKRPKTTIIEGRIVNQRDTHSIKFRKEQKSHINYKVIDGFAWVPVKSVEMSQEKEDVFNLEVEDDNSYISNGVAVHNCQSFSKAGNQEGFQGKSGLFYTFVDALKSIKPKYFLMENVEMKKEWQDEITSQLGVEPVKINSKLVSAQSRPRIYWCNFNFSPPTDKGIKLSDVLDSLNSKFNHTQKAIDYLNRSKMNQRFVSYEQNDKSPCITANFCKGVPYNVLLAGKKNQDRPEFKLGSVRKFTPEECEKLQTLPVGYTSCVADTQRYKSIGNGWTVDVIAHILSFLPNK